MRSFHSVYAARRPDESQFCAAFLEALPAFVARPNNKFASIAMKFLRLFRWDDRKKTDAPTSLEIWQVMRELKNFSVKDWFELRPVIQAAKQWRNDLVLKAFLRSRPAELENFLRHNERLRGRNLVQLIAFEQPQVLKVSVKMASRNLTDAVPLVFDNSRHPQARAENEQICREHNVAYLPLPPNPARHANRSHGLAMTWIWHHVVKPLEPAIAGFIDHDLIAVEKIEVHKLVNGQPFYGLPNIAKWGWSLWAGYCFYDVNSIASLPLNFLNDFSRELDTGGRNWDCLYGRHNPRRLRFAHLKLFDLIDPSTGKPRRLEVIDGAWIHIGGVSHRDDYQRNPDFYGRITEAIESGADWAQIQTTVGGPEKVYLTSKETILKSRKPRWRTLVLEPAFGMVDSKTAPAVPRDQRQTRADNRSFK